MRARTTTRWWLGVVGAVCVGACGGAQNRTASPVTAGDESAAPAERAEQAEATTQGDQAGAHAPPRAPGPLTRAEAEAFVARGLGAFLARVTVSPVFDAGRFVGFRLDAAQDLADWNAAGADVRVGDVVLRINGIRIERPEQALWAFERLRIAEAIDVDALRGGRAVRIHSPIVAGGSVASAPASASAPVGASASAAEARTASTAPKSTLGPIPGLP